MGVWRGEEQLLDWCPTVTRHLASYSKRGEVSSRRVTIEVGGYTATVSLADVSDGKAWQERFPSVAGVGERAVREILRNIIDDQARDLPLIPLHPQWVDGRLQLPPLDTMPAGYGETAGSPEAWTLMMREVARSPRMALFCGLALGGLYVRPLGLRSFMVHIGDLSSVGKTTAMYAASAIFGRPDDLVLKWNVTGQGPTAWLRTLGLLTGFRDELTAGNFTPAKLESLIFGLMEGAQRDASSRTQEYRESTGSWHGALMSTGNVGIAAQMSNTGIVARLVEITAPITIDREHAMAVEQAARHCYGHALQAFITHGPPPEVFSEDIAKAFIELNVTEGGVPGRIADHLALGIAGTRLLAKLCGVDALAEHVVDTAAAILAEMQAGLRERGVSPGDQLLAAVYEDYISHPATWPTRADYANQSTSYPLREVTGWDLFDEPGIGGDLAIQTGALKKLAEGRNIGDFHLALRELRNRGLLLVHDQGGRRDRHLQYSIALRGKVQRVYVFRNIERTLTSMEDPPPGPVPLPSVAEALGSPAPGAGQDDTPQEGDAAVPSQRPPAVAFRPRPDAQMAAFAQEGDPIFTVDEGKQPCVHCGDPTVGRVDGKPSHRTMAVCASFSPAYAAAMARAGLAAGAQKQPAASEPSAAAQMPPPARTAPEQQRPSTPAPRGTEQFLDDLAVWFPASTLADRQAAHVLWHKHMRGISWSGAGNTALRILQGALKHASIPELPPFDPQTVAPLFDGQIPRYGGRLWVVPGFNPQLGDLLISNDVNGMYVPAANIDLGLGAPDYTDELPGGADWAKVTGCCGWAVLNSVPQNLPYGLHGRIRPGEWIPLPHLSWLADGLWLPDDERSDWSAGALDVCRVAYWPAGKAHPRRRRVLRPHVEFMRTARTALLEYPRVREKGSPENMALECLKAVYTRMFGGVLASEKYNSGDTLRKDWAELVKATAQARMFRALDKATLPIIGIYADAAWALAPPGHGPEIPGLQISTGEITEVNKTPWQLGKWKPAGIAVFGEAELAAYRTQTLKPLYNAFKKVKAIQAS